MSENDKKIHILVHDQHFYPEEFRINDIAKSLVQRGYKVTVITGIPNYPKGEFFEGYGYRSRRRETWEGMDIIRIPIIPRGHNKLQLIFNYFSFPISGFFWNMKTKVDADYVFMFETSPMTQCKVGCRYGKKHKVPVILYMQDIWPESIEMTLGIHNKILLAPIVHMVNKIYKGCDKILVTSESLRKLVDSRVDREGLVEFYPQYAEESYFPIDKEDCIEAYKKSIADKGCYNSDADKGTNTLEETGTSSDSFLELLDELANDTRFKIMFTGNIGQAQGLEILSEAAKGLEDGLKKEILFVIVGDGRYKQELLEIIEKDGTKDSFKFIDRQPSLKIPYLLSMADVAFLSVKDGDYIPAKMQSYMACAKPILVCADGEPERIINESNAGLCSHVEDAVALRKNIIKLYELKKADGNALDEMGQRAYVYNKEHFDKEKLLDQLETYFDKDKYAKK